jgi:hypothetical protein
LRQQEVLVADEEITNRLDLILATLRLAFARQLHEARDEMRKDDVTAAILDETGNWTLSTDVQSRVAKSTGKTERRVRDRLPGLVEQGVLATRGTERKLEYRRTGLI